MAGTGSFAGSGGTLYDPRATGKQPFVLFHDLPPIAADKVYEIREGQQELKAIDVELKTAARATK